MKSVKKIEVLWDEEVVGSIMLQKESLCVFEYSAEYIASQGVSISPFELPIKQGVKIARPRPFDGGFGVFDDSLPDGWGMLILDRYLQKIGENPHKLSILDRLALVGSSGRGALEYRPDYKTLERDDFIEFEKLSAEAELILSSEEYYGEGIEEFQQRGGSPGGARPKVFAKFDGKEWLVKFRAKGDNRDIGAIEYRYSLLAKKCGIDMPETKLVENKYFATERFDRKDGRKLHTVSVAGLLCADYRISCIDYSHIFQVCNALTRSTKELWKIYRLMCFNYLIGNKDDHAKNFAFIYDGEKWCFSPAYDLLPSNGMNGFHTTSINDNIEPSKSDLLSVAEKVGLPKNEAEIIFDEIETIIRDNKI